MPYNAKTAYNIGNQETKVLSLYQQRLYAANTNVWKVNHSPRAVSVTVGFYNKNNLLTVTVETGNGTTKMLILKQMQGLKRHH